MKEITTDMIIEVEVEDIAVAAIDAVCLKIREGKIRIDDPTDLSKAAAQELNELYDAIIKQLTEDHESNLNFCMRIQKERDDSA
jgi:hypothetical protein